MNRKSTQPIPEPIVQLQRQLDRFRGTQTRRTKLPESLWRTTVELARQHGVYSVAHPLRLDYMGLKRRLGGVPPLRRKTTKPAQFCSQRSCRLLQDSSCIFRSTTYCACSFIRLSRILIAPDPGSWRLKVNRAPTSAPWHPTHRALQRSHDRDVYPRSKPVVVSR